MNNFGTWLSKQRKEKGWSIYKLQKVSGVSRQAILKIESGGDVKISTAIQLCRALCKSYKLE